jgi:hypothetical protein
LTSDDGARGTLGVELNVAMPSCDGPGGAYVDGDTPLGGFAGTFRLDSRTRLDLADSELGGSLRLMCSEPATIEAHPLYTVSQSEAGFEKIMQAATVRASWPIVVSPGGKQTIEVRLMVRG